MKKLVDMDIVSFSSVHFAKHITQKALIMHDRSDQTIPHTQSIAVHNALSNSELVLTEKTVIRCIKLKFVRKSYYFYPKTNLP
jgi:hypothetical protein